MALIYAYGTKEVTVDAADSLAVFTTGTADVYLRTGYPNEPNAWAFQSTVSAGQTVFGAYASGAVLRIDNTGAAQVSYVTGVSPSNNFGVDYLNLQGAPTAMTTAASITPAGINSRIITGTHTAGATQAYTLPTGTVLDASNEIAIGQAIDWTLINLSAAAADTITVTAATDHTIVGNPIVQSAHSSTGGIYGNSSQWRSRKTAANTFVTYRIA